MYKTLYKTGFAGYALLLIMAAVFYKERSIFMDSACHLFYILLTDDFAIQHNRFGAVVTQIFPLLSSKLGFSLNTTLILYSIGTMAYYFLCYIICGTVLKQYRYALVVLLFSILFASDTFFWPYSELQQGCTMLLVMFAIISTSMNSILKYVITIALTIVLVFIHPLIIFPASFLFLYQLLRKESPDSNKLYLVRFIIFIVAYYIKTHYFTAAYEAKATGGIDSKIVNLLPHYFNLYSVKKFIADCAGKYIWIPVFTLTTIVYYFINRKWLLVAFYTVFVTAYISIINLSFETNTVPPFYIENQFLPLSIFIAAPIIFEVTTRLNKKLSIAILLVLIISGTFRIAHKHNVYAARLNWERDFLKENGDRKLVIHESHIPLDTLMMSWGTSYEFWLLSTVEQGKTASIVISSNIEPLIPPPNKPKSFITEYNGYPYSMLPEKYFKFKDTTTEYEVIK